MRISLKSSGNPESRESQATEAKHPLWSKELIEKAVKNYLGEKHYPSSDFDGWGGIQRPVEDGVKLTARVESVAGGIEVNLDRFYSGKSYIKLPDGQRGKNIGFIKRQDYSVDAAMECLTDYIKKNKSELMKTFNELKNEEQVSESRSLNEEFDPLITNIHQLRRCVMDLWDLKTKSELESKAKDADGRIADFKKRIAKDRIKIANQLEIWAKATIRLLFDDEGWEGLSESGNEFEAMARSIVETSLKETGLESNIRALENSLRESSETELMEGNTSAAKKWLDSMIRKHGNTYHWPPELKAKLDSLIRKHGNTYYWSESDGHE